MINMPDSDATKKHRAAWLKQQTGTPRDLLRATTASALALLVASLAAWIGVSWLLARQWPWRPFGQAASQTDILKISLGVVAALGAAVALVVNYRKQRHLEHDEAGRRDLVRLYTERFGAAATQLGGEQAAVRLAGVYAMAALADEWEAQRQQCIDVLCGYLRLPYSGEPPPGHPESISELRHYADGRIQRTEVSRFRQGERQIRRAITEVIRQHLQKDAPFSWGSYHLDLSDATLIDASFQGAHFQGTIHFDRATFVGEYPNFTECVFSGSYTSFDGAVFKSGHLQFSSAKFSGSEVTFTSAIFDSKDTNFDDTTFSAVHVAFDDAVFQSGHLNFSQARFSGQKTSFTTASFPCYASFSTAIFSANETDFSGARFLNEDTYFFDTQFRSDHTTFAAATFVDVNTAMLTAKFLKPDAVEWGPIPPP